MKKLLVVFCTVLLLATATISLAPHVFAQSCPDTQVQEGDYNCDGSVTIADFVAWIVAYFNNGSSLENFEYWRRSVNKAEIIPTPTTAPITGTYLPTAIHYYHYSPELDSHQPTYIYGNTNREYDAIKTQTEIAGLADINGPVVKMLMVSRYDALEQIIANHGTQIAAAGITWIGYNTERDGRTPEPELSNTISTNASINSVNRIGKLAQQHNLKLMWGPTTPMWNELFGGGQYGTGNATTDATARAMVGDNCYLDGIAFQEQNQLNGSNMQDRVGVVSHRTNYFRDRACDGMESWVQIMPHQCSLNTTWDNCRTYYQLLTQVQGSGRVNIVGVWANPNLAERELFYDFIRFLWAED